MSQNTATEEDQMSRTSNIEIGFDSAFLDKWLKFEKLAYIVIAVLLLAGLAGVLGRGPLSKSTAKSDQGDLKVRYEKIAHNKTPAVIELMLPAEVPASGQVRLRLEGDLVRRGRFQRIVPQPIRSEP